MEITKGATRIVVEQGDLTTIPVDAIVNAANPYMVHGGGLASAIVRAGGEEIQKESTGWVEDHGPLRTGVAAVTGAGRLQCKVVIHVAGPVWERDADNETLLRTAVRAALDAAGSLRLRSVALPAVSAGIYGYPTADATRAIAAEACKWAAGHGGVVAEIRLVGFNREVTDGFEEGLRRAQSA